VVQPVYTGTVATTFPYFIIQLRVIRWNIRRRGSSIFLHVISL